MGVLKNPLLSLDARKTLSKAITFVKRRGQNIAEACPIPTDPQTTTQLDWRHMFNKCVALWHLLSPAEKQEWESNARSRHMTGYAWYISQCLRPNPGIYLPLQGGTMSGNIDMAKHRLLRLPLPTDSQEPLTLAYFTAYIAPYLYDEGARVYHSIAQAIPSGAWTTLAFDSERWDTDSIHDTVVFNSRLTCKTAGRYLVCGGVDISVHAVGIRRLNIRLNAVTTIAVDTRVPSAAFESNLLVSTIINLAVTDFVELNVYQNSGIPRNANAFAHYSPAFMIERIGP